MDAFSSPLKYHHPTKTEFQINSQPDSWRISTGEGVWKPPVERFSIGNEILLQINLPRESLDTSSIFGQANKLQTSPVLRAKPSNGAFHWGEKREIFQLWNDFPVEMSQRGEDRWKRLMHCRHSCGERVLGQTQVASGCHPDVFLPSWGEFGLGRAWHGCTRIPAQKK